VHSKIFPNLFLDDLPEKSGIFEPEKVSRNNQFVQDTVANCAFRPKLPQYTTAITIPMANL
jgi:hypothetical protein